MGTVSATGQNCDCSGNDCSATQFCYDSQCNASAKPCTVDNTNPTNEICGCSGNECTATQFCYDGSCHDKAAMACTADYTNAQTEKCYKPGHEDEFCAANDFYYAGECRSSGCAARDKKDVFYGSKLRGEWDADNRRMNMHIKTPHDVMITEIQWKDAASTALKYSPMAPGSWTLDTTSEPCKKKYYLNVEQNTFFGSGSKFTLKGSQLKTDLIVKASQSLTEVHLGKTYRYDRKISNIVPLIVNLKTSRKFVVTFKIPPIEGETFFAFFQGATDNLDTAEKNIELDLEIHSTNCVNTTRTDSSYTKGARVKEASQDHLLNPNESTFEWGASKWLDQNDLCVQTFEWTFVPKPGLIGGTYEMIVEFVSETGSLHEAIANIFIEEADVLGDIGFDGTMVLYEEKECINEKELFYLGDHIYAKISLTHLVINAENITCSEFTITQKDPITGRDVPTDMMAEEKYDFQEYAVTDANGNKVQNNWICSAEIQSPHFHKTADGYKSNLAVNVTIDYETDAGTRRRQLTLHHPGFSNFPTMGDEMLLGDSEIPILEDEEESVGLNEEDEYYENKMHDPEQTDFSKEFIIKKAVENMNPFKAMQSNDKDGSVSSFYEKYTTVIIISSIALFGGILLAGLYRSSKRSPMESALLVDEEI